MTKNRTPTTVYLDPGMHLGLEVKGLTSSKDYGVISFHGVMSFHEIFGKFVIVIVN